MVFTFLLKDFTLPYGVNAGAYRYSRATRSLTPVVVPFVTAAPGGGRVPRGKFRTDDQQPWRHGLRRRYCD
jgi:hypothetical protein